MDRPPKPEDLDRLMKEMSAHLDMRRKEGFTSWLQNPLVQIMASMMPEGPAPEALTKLLEATYDAGFNTGTAATAEAATRIRGTEKR